MKLGIRTRTASLLTLVVISLAGCGGGGSDPATPAVPVVTSPVTPQEAIPKTAVSAAQMTPEQWSALTLSGAVSAVTVGNGPPQVAFTVTDASGNGVTGLAQKDSSGAYPNFAFGIAKLIPGDPVTQSPSRWVSYFTFASAPVPDKPVVPMFPEPENNGTLKDNLDGTYNYTFALDITKAKSYADGAAFDALHLKSDLDDLTYEPTLPHRLIVAVGGSKSGSKATVSTSANLSYDFIPSTGKAPSSTDPRREIVTTASCNGCHSKLNLHEDRIPAMHDTKLCVVCHTEQVKFGSGESMPASGNVLVPAGAYAAYGATLRLQGRAIPNFPNMVHKIHMGNRLYFQGYNQFGTRYNEITYPQPITNCVKCHDGSAKAANQTPQGDNWKMVPSRLACGSCHDGIDFDTGRGKTLSGRLDAVGHAGGARTDDKSCATCHNATNIPRSHVTVDRTGSSGRGGYPLNTAQDVPTPGFPAGQGPAIPLMSQLNPPAGAYIINYEIKQSSVNGAAGAKRISVVYRILKDGQPVTLNATGSLIDNVIGSPAIMVAYALPQDGIAEPADWNFVANSGGGVPVIDIRDNKNGDSQTGPDANGFYTATLSLPIPDNARMVTTGLGLSYQGFIQTNLADYPKGIRLRESQFVMKTADGYAPRRAVVSNDKCDNCHGQLGVGPSFHAGARNNGEGCAACHQPDTATGHVGAANSFGGGWSVQIKNLVHSIHGSAKRTRAFNYEATAANPDGFKEITYPGVLRNCEQCHVTGSYDFSGAANSAAVPNLLWATDAKGNMSNLTNAPSIGLSPWVSILGAGQVDYTKNNLVSSPIASSCFGCHDSTAAVGHMQTNGGTLVTLASTVSVGSERKNGFNKFEACLVCHGPGKVMDIKTVHMK